MKSIQSNGAMRSGATPLEPASLHTSFPQAMITLGIDVGGTFTDLVMRNSRTGELRSLKTPTTPPTYANGVMNAIGRTGAAPDAIADIAHGTARPRFGEQHGYRAPPLCSIAGA